MRQKKVFFSSLQPPVFRLQPRHILLIAVFSVLCACVSGEAYIVSPNLRSAPDSRVAVLPFNNMSTDITAAEYLRKLSGEHFSKRGYTPVAFEDADEKLKVLGISDGGQLPSVSPERLGVILGTDLLCYGDVEDFTFQNAGFVVRKSVVLRLKIVSASSGETLFEASGAGKSIKFYLKKEEAKKAFIDAAVVKLVESIFKSPLHKEAEAALGRVFDKMPRR
ncbi:MAG TPA: hypothetical protein DCL44_02340 [Elusimicrobia bacterium]|nr:hypothetical protein [Elusimicrobiota bacterium]